MKTLLSQNNVRSSDIVMREDNIIIITYVLHWANEEHLKLDVIHILQCNM
jgi:hypothetical protein